MNIVVLADSFPPYLSGVTTICVELARELLKRGNKVLIFTPDHPNKIRPPGLESAKILYLSSFSTHVPGLRICFPNTFKVVKEIRKFQADIIETEAPSFLGIDGIIASKVLKVPSVSVFHTLLVSNKYLQIIFKTKSDLIEKISWIYHRWFYNAGDMIFVWTKQMADLLTKNGIEKRKIEIMTPLFDYHNVKILRKDTVKKAKEKYSLNKNVAVFLGRVSPEKRLDFLIQVWSQVVKVNKDCTLLIIGDGLYMSQLKRLVSYYKLEEYVRFTGLIEHEMLLSSGILSACDLFVSASISETFGLTGIEAMAHGIPVVLAKSQGLAEMVKDAGFVCQADDADCFKESILEIFDNLDLKRKMGKKARETSKNYSTPVVVGKILNKYENLVN